MRLDHVILATDDLDRTCRRLGNLGLGWVPGGRHDNIGTLNRIVPLGTGYLELLTVVDKTEARTSAFGGWALQTLAAGKTMMGWAVAVDDIDEIADHLSTPVETIARAGLNAHITGVSHAAAHPQLPFFIARSAGVSDPGRAKAPHGVRVDGFARLELGGDRESLEAWVPGFYEPGQTELIFTPGASGFLGAGIRTAGGVLRL